MNAIVTRLSQPSTYAGLMGVVMLFGVSSEGFSVYAEALAGVFAFLTIILNEAGTK